MKRIFTTTLVLLLTFYIAIGQQTFDRDKYVVAGFYPYMKDYILQPEDIDIDKLTHVVFAFAFPRADGSIGTESGSYHTKAQPLADRLHAQGKKLVLLMGGGTQSGGYHDMAATPETRTTYINNLVSWMETYGYDGINIDWEYPGANSKDEDRDNLTALVIEMRQAFDEVGARLGKYIEISIDVHSSLYYAQWVDFDALKDYIDWFGLMAYDYAGNWSYCIHAAHNAPLYCGPAEICDRYLCVDRGIQNLRDSLNISPDQIVMGIPFYGAEFYNSELYETPREGGGAKPYYDIEPLIGNGWERHWDDQSLVPYLLKTSGSGVMTYDDPESIGIKCDYIEDNVFLGAMIWEITQDVNKETKEQPLLNVVGELVGVDRDVSGRPSVSITSPADQFVFTPGQDLSIQASATVETGFSIDRVEFYNSNQLLGSDNSVPYEYTWNSIPEGKYTLSAIAYSSNGKSSTSQTVFITDGLLPEAVEMFDDFNYINSDDPALAVINNWSIVDGVSGPPSNAVYAKENITFFPDPDLGNNVLMGVATTANNNPTNNRHARIETADMPYQKGTFAARVFFDDTPVQYSDGNVETFYTINSYATCNNPDLYSEVDFEYLPWDSWHWERKNTMYMTTWETCEIRTHEKSVVSYAGWHDLVFTYIEGEPVKWYIDGNLIASINEDLPDSDQNISFANWIYQNTTGSDPTTRTTTMMVDWVYHAKDIVLELDDIQGKVNNFRTEGIVSKNLAGNVRYAGTTLVPPTVSITAPADNSTFDQGSSISVSANAADSDGSVAQVEFFVNGTSQFVDTESPYSFTYLADEIGSVSITAKATDNDNLSTTSSAVNVAVEAIQVQDPYPSGAHLIPGTLEAENYDTGGEGVAYHDATDGNSGNSYRTDNVDIEACTQGGYNVGWIANEEWLEYTVNVQSAGVYTLSFDVASTTFVGNMNVVMNGTNVTGNIETPATGGWQTWTTVIVENVQLSQGTQVMRLNIPVGSFNLDKIVFTLQGDQVPPSCALITPVNGQEFNEGDIVSIEATASDSDGSINQVEFFVDGNSVGIDYSAPYQTDYVSAVGSHTITAIATDNDNLSGSSSAVNIQVLGQAVSPVINITSPANNSNFIAGNSVDITAEASDADGSVTKVDFYMNGSLLSTDLNAPYSATISNISTGTYELYAVATDNDNLTGTSSAIQINVEDGGTPADLEVIYTTIVAWGDGFQGQVTIINHSNVTATDWIVEFDCGNRIASIWDAQVLEHTGDHYKFNGPSIAPNSSHVFGFIGNVLEGQVLSLPVNVSVVSNKSAKAISSSEPLSSYNFPNPFSGETTISFSLQEEGKVNISIYNMQGKLVEVLVDEVMSVGEHSVNWDAQGFAAGSYLYKIMKENSTPETKAMLLVKE